MSVESGWLGAFVKALALAATGLALSWGSPPAWAVTSFTPGDVSGLTDQNVRDLLRTVAIGAAPRAYMPATPLGVLLGIDIGVDLTGIAVPSEFQAALASATQQPAANIPGLVAVPRVSVHKGLPFGIDLGASYSTYQSLFKSIGADVKWAFVDGGVVSPSVAARVTGDYASLWFMNTHNYTADLLVSKNLLIIDPYLGGGMQFWSGTLAVPTGGSGGLPPTISADKSGTSTHVFAGIPLKLLALKLTVEVDHSFAGPTTYGGKISVGF